SVRLVRLASESVLLGWTGMTAGHYVVRAAAVSLGGVRTPTTLSDPASDAVLRDLATGPRGDAVAIWSSAPRTPVGFNAARESLGAARGLIAAPATAIFGRPETIAAAGPNVAPAIAIDPASDRTIVAWRAAGSVRYAVREAGPHG